MRGATYIRGRQAQQGNALALQVPCSMGHHTDLGSTLVAPNAASPLDAARKGAHEPDQCVGMMLDFAYGRRSADSKASADRAQQATQTIPANTTTAMLALAAAS